MKSALYVGQIAHRRHTPRENVFCYRIYMTLLDLNELPSLFDRFWLWSARRPALAWFRRADFHGDHAVPLDEAVRNTVAAHTGQRPTGPIRLLTHLRYFGISFNPVSFYYVYNAADTSVETIVAEITNTPWRERHSYVLPMNTEQRWRFGKTFHVSPFMPMNMDYDWRLSSPNDTLRVHMENWQHGQKAFDATLTLKREPINSVTLARALLSVPWVSLKVIVLIHWQALKLWCKRVPFITHPDKITPTQSHRP